MVNFIYLINRRVIIEKHWKTIISTSILYDFNEKADAEKDSNIIPFTPLLNGKYYAAHILRNDVYLVAILKSEGLFLFIYYNFFKYMILFISFIQFFFFSH